MLDTKELIAKNLFVIKNGRITFFEEIDYIMYPTEGMAINFQKMGEDLGTDVLFQIGYKTGAGFWDSIMKTLNAKKDYIPNRLNSISFVLELSGQGKISLNQEVKGKVIVKVENNPCINEARKLFRTRSVVCHYFAGFYSAIISKQLKIDNLKLKETKCKTLKGSYCEFTYTK